MEDSTQEIPEYQFAELDLDTQEIEDILVSLITAHAMHTEDHLRRAMELDHEM